MAGLALNGKVVNLVQLRSELATAGITVPALGTEGGFLFTYNESGNPTDLPAGSAAVVTAHVPELVASVRSAAVSAATSAVGVQLVNLTPIQQRALLACLLYKAGAIDSSLTVLPLNQWLS